MSRSASFLFTIVTAAALLALPGFAVAKDRIVVDPDGNGDFKTVQEAVDSVPSKNDHRVVIEVHPGTYNQVLTIPKDKPFISLLGTGDAPEKVILTFDNFAQKIAPDGKPFGTRRTGSTFIYGADFFAENLTFQNDAGPVGQAVALFINADRGVFQNCRFIGWQDTLYVNANRQYFEDCYIAGHVDYIFGSSICWFENCELHCRQKGSITAASTTQAATFGYVFNHCKITKDDEVPASTTILGRPWRPYGSVTFLDTQMADIVEPRGWDNWANSANESTARYAEWNSSGPGANPEKRLPWTHQLTEEQAKAITIQKVLGGSDNWDPANADATEAAPPIFATPTVPAEIPKLNLPNVTPTTLPSIPRPVIPDHTFTITDYGAVADGKTMNTDAIDKAMDACDKAGGGNVVVPAGKFLTGPIVLSSSMNLHLDKGATLLMSNKLGDYPNTPGGHDNCVSARDCHDVAITGEGVIDGQGEPWWTAFNREKYGTRGNPRMPHRPFLVSIRSCTRLLVQGVTLTNSPMFHLAPQACTDAIIDHVTFLSPDRAPNTDALDPSGKNFLISNCYFDVGDDCIAIKAAGRGDAEHPSCEDFVVTDCTLKHGHGLSIGGQTAGGLRHLVVRNCTFEDTEAGIRMKAPRGNGGLVDDCLYENIVMKNVKNPIYITSFYPENTTPKDPTTAPSRPVGRLTPIWRNIRINNMTATDNPNAGKIVGLPEMPASDITLTNVNISADKPMWIWYAKGVHFVNSQVTVKNGDALDLKLAEDVTGIDPKTGKPN
jgi:pectin methylesterase-like acyl-CoA thioesterase